jgi:hypothetical protein
MFLIGAISLERDFHPHIAKKESTMGSILDYFNLSPRAGINILPAEIPWAWQLALYGALVLGILANGILAAARSRRKYRFDGRKFIISAIVGLVIFPGVYEGSQANLGQPTLVQLALVFASGLGYESLFSGVVGLAGGTRR